MSKMLISLLRMIQYHNYCSCMDAVCILSYKFTSIPLQVCNFKAASMGDYNMGFKTLYVEELNRILYQYLYSLCRKGSSVGLCKKRTMQWEPCLTPPPPPSHPWGPGTAGVPRGWRRQATTRSSRSTRPSSAPRCWATRWCSLTREP